MKMQAGAERFGAVTKYGEVISAELEGNIKKVRTSSDEFGARTVVIATGANPRELGVDREEEFVSRGVHYCAHCDGRFYKNKVVAVVGGGNSALEDALYLSRLAAKVYLIHRRDSLRAERIHHEPLSRAETVEFKWNATVTALHGEDKLTGITVQSTKNGESEQIALDGLFISIGRSPETALFDGQLALENGYILAGEDTKTSIPGVFAAGDVRKKALRQIVTAAADGAIAAHFAEEYIETEYEQSK
jgi:thioredoxin reductase (NADPH)